MAEAALNGCVYNSFSDTDTLKQKEFVSEEKLLNGKLNNHKNGFVKSEHLNNGVTVSKICF